MHSSFKSDHVVVFLLTEHVVFKHVTKGSVADWIGYLGAWYDGRKQANYRRICFPHVISAVLESTEARFSAVKLLDSAASGTLSRLTFAVPVTSANCEFIIQEIVCIVPC